MWCPDDCVCLAEITTQFLWDTDDVPIASEKALEFDGDWQTIDGLEADAFVVWLTWGFLRHFRDNVRVCLPSGNLVRVTPPLHRGNLIDPLDKTFLGSSISSVFPSSYSERIKLSQWEFSLIDLHLGTILDRGLDEELRSLNGFPICIREKDLPTSLDRLTEWLMDAIPKWTPPTSLEPWSSRSEASAIVAAYHQGRISSKLEAKKLFGKGLPTLAWKALWKEATALDPRLSKPGRR